MSSRSAAVPRSYYLLAAAVGLFGVPFVYILGGPLSEEVSGEEWAGIRMVIMAVLAFCYALLGAAFGLMWPAVNWRWGVWLCAAPACLLSFYFPDVWFFLGWLVLTVLPAGSAAYVASRLGSRTPKTNVPMHGLSI
jgi:hypothetical protein